MAREEKPMYNSSGTVSQTQNQQMQKKY